MVALPTLSTNETRFIVGYQLVLASSVLTLRELLIFLRFQDTQMRGVAAGPVGG